MEETMPWNRNLKGRRFNLIHLLMLMTALTLAVPAFADGRVIKQRVSPVYPEVAKRMRIGGLVKMEVTVSTEGKVVSVKTVSGNRMLSTAAEDAVKQWHFAAGSEESVEIIDMNFALAQ
jgi:TonB family protein